MGFAAILGLLAPIFSSIITRVFPDPEKQAEAQIELQKLLGQAQAEAYKADAVAMETKKEVLVTEMSQGGWASQWRSYLMMACISIVAYNWVIVSFLNAFLRPMGVPIDAVAVPPELWTLITVGLGGYLTKETMNSYSQGKVEIAKSLNPAPVVNEAMLARALRKNLFKDGMTQEQWDAILKSTNEAVE